MNSKRNICRYQSLATIPHHRTLDPIRRASNQLETNPELNFSPCASVAG